MSIKRNPVSNAPTLLHSVALVAPTVAETVRNIRKMDVGLPPDLYSPTHGLVRASLAGQGYAWTEKQADTFTKPEQKSAAVEVLPHLRMYLESTEPTWLRPLDVEYFQVSETLQIPIRVSGLMSVNDEPRVLLVHLWRKRLEIDQLRAALTMLRRRILGRQELREARLNLVDVSVDPRVSSRSYRLIEWDTFSLMVDDELKAFTDRLEAAWTEYQTDPAPKPPRKPRPGDTDDLFDPRPR